MSRDVHYQSFVQGGRQTNKQNENRTDVKYQTLQLINLYYIIDYITDRNSMLQTERNSAGTG